MHAFYKRHLMMNSYMSGYYAHLASSYESDINLESQIHNCERTTRRACVNYEVML